MMLARKPTCFVMMPSGNHGEYRGEQEESDYIFKGIIVPALVTVYGEDVDVLREVDNRKPGAITSEIIKRIAAADIGIVDVTGQNPNVFLELGIRYSLKRGTTILLCQEGSEVPFDIKNYRLIMYSPNFFGSQKAQDDIIEALRSVEEAPDDTDSLVFEVLPQLEVRLPDSTRGLVSRAQADMPWTTFWNHLSKVVAKIQDHFRDGRYEPSVVVGITNGGAMYADLLGRELFEGLPLVSLWADRRHRLSSEGDYFNNSINEAVVAGLKVLEKGLGEKFNILLVDDIVASGTTHMQALQYLKKKIDGVELWFLPLFSRNDKYFDLVKSNIIWKHPTFDLTDQEIVDIHWTSWPGLPYNKDMRST